MRKKTRFIIECRCGCGGLIETPDKYCRERRYKKGHHWRGASRPYMREVNKKRIIPHTIVGGVEGKICSKCKDWKPLDSFVKSKDTYDGLERRCRACIKIKRRKYYEAHAEEIATKRNTREYREKFNAYCRERDKTLRRTGPNYKLKKNLRSSLLSAIKRNTKSGHTLELLGCTIDELRMHLQFQFLPGMTWDNWSQSGWEIDHIIPVSAFDLSRPEHQQRCFHYLNLQPLWHDDNMLKGDYVPEGIII